MMLEDHWRPRPTAQGVAPERRQDAGRDRPSRCGGQPGTRLLASGWRPHL